LHLVGDLFELNVKLRCQKVKPTRAGQGGTVGYSYLHDATKAGRWLPRLYRNLMPPIQGRNFGHRAPDYISSHLTFQQRQIVTSSGIWRQGVTVLVAPDVSKGRNVCETSGIFYRPTVTSQKSW